ncbi:MAG: BrnT family toxin [Thermomicrobiales bacterium]
MRFPVVESSRVVWGGPVAIPDQRRGFCCTTSGFLTIQWAVEGADSVRIHRLVFGGDRVEHIARHGVSVAEVEEIAYGDFVVARTRNDRYGLIGQTDGGRYLYIVVAPRGSGIYGLVTARDATDRERRAFRDQRGR